MLSADQLLLFIRQVLQESSWLMGGFIAALILILFLVFLIQGVLQHARANRR